MRLRLRLKLRLRLRARAKVRVRVRVGVRFRVRVRVRVGLRDLVPVDLDVACALQASEPHEEAAHGEGAGPADALEGIPGAEAGERAEGSYVVECAAASCAGPRASKAQGLSLVDEADVYYML